MKNIVEHLQHHNIICKKLTQITPRKLGTRKKIEIFTGVDIGGYYCILLHLSKKSRVLTKEATSLITLHNNVEKYKDRKIKKKYIWIEAPLCSKAKALMESEGWKFL